ncbi:response regulator [Desulfobacterales bacterium HSG17]|nr:response regulator [Desulfobacterales bacterium HSG17]
MKGKVLIVDDDPKIGRLLKFKLSKADYETEYFNSGGEALEKIPMLKPHIIVSDIDMPNMNGYEFCEKLRQDSRTASIPFIFLSGRTDTTDQLEGLRLGADDYVCKPVKIDFLLERMEKVMDRAIKAKSFKSQADFSGNLSQMSLNDVMQIVESNHKSGELEFTTSEGKTMGRIMFNKGNLMKAQFGFLDGAEAFYGLMDEEEGFFEFFGKVINEPEQITMTNMAALLQGSRLIDEGKSLYSILTDLEVTLSKNSVKIPPEVTDRCGKERLQKILLMAEKQLTANEIINSGKMSRPRASSILTELLNIKVLSISQNKQEQKDRKKEEKSGSGLAIEDWLLTVMKNVETRKLSGSLEIGNRPLKQMIFFHEGCLAHAFHGKVIGKKALYRIFADKGGAPKFQAHAIVVKHTIDDDMNELIEDGNREVGLLKELRKASFNNIITVNHQHMEKVSRIKSRPGLTDVLTLVMQHDQVKDIIDASLLTDLRTYNHLLTMVKLGVINIQKGK